MTESAYWRSDVSVVGDSTVRVRGYDLETLIGRLTYADSVHLLIRGELPTKGERRVLDSVLTAVLDYALQKPGTVAARFIASANPSMSAALAGAALAVGEYTLDPSDTVRFALEQSRAFEASDESLEAFAERAVAQLRAEKKRIPGIGHPVFRFEDPRAQKLRDVAIEEGVWNSVGDVYEALHRAFTALPGKESIPVNDVGMMGLLLAQLGYTAEESTGISIISTLPGVVAHVSEELASRTPIRIIHPDQVEYSSDERSLPTEWEYAR
ncbi:citryl-CoA lyase [Microbacterium sp.]|uniref:citryl-CoA lyase n=1 Tax=Microbacterium sp. TaxID=51671 RepID=UPI002811F7F9|nr:citryl-CoA lyase [Microbacterium sp.]